MWRLGRREEREKDARPEIKAAAAIVSDATPAAPSRATRWKEFIRVCLAADGYLVQPSSEELETRSTVRVWGSDEAFEVLGPAGHEDAIRQWRTWQQISGEKMEAPAPPSGSCRYFKFGARAA